jgi:hypothetical protein
MSPRAEIVETGSPWVRSARIVIDAPSARIFEVLADPRLHPEFDGSGTVTGSVSGPERLALGSKFGMSMHLGVSYRITNTVVEFEEGRLIAWRHLNRHRWRYALEPVGDRSTLVTETFDGSTALVPASLKAINAYENNEKAMAKTLVRLKTRLEDEEAGT